MDTDTAGNPIHRPSAYCSWCGGPTDTAGNCQHGCEHGVAVVAASSLDTAEAQIAALREENARLRAAHQESIRIRAGLGEAVLRLEGLILGWDSRARGGYEAVRAEAKRIRGEK